MREKILLGWSGGKDSAMALHRLRQSDDCEIVALLTTVTEVYDRISMHGVRRSLLERQSEAAGVPLHEVFIPPQCPNEVYEEAMREALAHFQAQGVTACAFGDLFLEDVRQYREERLGRIGMRGLFPLWGRDTADMLRQFIGLGFKARIACLDPRKLDRAFAGRVLNESFHRDLPPGVDPCGENGEFHTFVYEGPIFTHPIRCATGEVVEREGFVFCDLLPE